MLSVFRKFKLKGNRPFLRTDEEMKSIDKVEADKAFKLYKKEHIDTLLKSKGFIKYSTKRKLMDQRLSPLTMQ